MPRYKRIETGLELLPVDFARQIMPDSFEHALRHNNRLNRFTLRGQEKVTGSGSSIVW